MARSMSKYLQKEARKSEARAEQLVTKANRERNRRRGNPLQADQYLKAAGKHRIHAANLRREAKS
jgi:hypothetical protein